MQRLFPDFFSNSISFDLLEIIFSSNQMEIVEKTIDVKVKILPNINTYLVMLVSTVAMANSTPAIIMTKK